MPVTAEVGTNARLYLAALSFLRSSAGIPSLRRRQNHTLICDRRPLRAFGRFRGNVAVLFARAGWTLRPYSDPAHGWWIPGVLEEGLRDFPAKLSPLVSLSLKGVQVWRIRSWKTPSGRQGIIPSQKYDTVDFVRVEGLREDVVGAQVEDFRPECGVGQARSNDEAGG